jgi:hypothetical protein
VSSNKTVATAIDVAAYLETVEPSFRREDAKALCALMQRLTGLAPKLWGPSMIGFGSYHYRYASGREGDMFRIGFAPRKANMVVYLVDGFAGYPDLLAKLGKHKTGQSCLYLGALGSIDGAVLEEMLRQSWAAMAQRYP